MPSQRERTHSAIAADAAMGSTPRVLANRYGYTVGGMRDLLKRPVMQDMVDEAQKRLELAARQARCKILFMTPELVDDLQEIIKETKQSGVDEETGEKLYTYKNTTGDRYRAITYLLDKVLPTVTHHVQEDRHTISHETLVEFRQELKVAQEVAPLRVVDITKSPHVFDGIDAIPKAIDVEVER